MVVSIRDVARLAGVSSATVSRVLTHKPHVREEVRQR
ncbi:MAG: LacI family DNA-binding transcriptional regulator, partial [Chloroflexi bacterium]|nr:LacI family DNA-binding transcriptional regulator [Chloroflexota bacterium]